MFNLTWQDVHQAVREIVQVVNRLSNTLRTNTEVSQTLYRGELPTANTTPIYTARLQAKATLREIVLCNTNAAARTFTLSIMDPATSEAASGRLYQDVAIAANETQTYQGFTLMNGEERLYLWASGAGVNARISGLEITAL